MCPCHSNKAYTECCKPYHDGKAAPTPLVLMRSRYSAYALKKIDYIIETGVMTRGTRKDIENFAITTSFDGLTIVEAEANFVTFTAHLTSHGQDVSYTEKSHFEKVNDRWRYTGSV